MDKKLHIQNIPPVLYSINAYTKRCLGLFALLTIFISGSYSQNDTINYLNSEDKAQEIEENETKVTRGKNKKKYAKGKNPSDTTRLKLGKRHFTFTCHEEGGTIDLLDTETGRAKRYFITEDGGLEQVNKSTADTNSVEKTEKERNWENFWSNLEDMDEPKKDSNKFRGHWSGIELGINDFASNGLSLKRPAGYAYLDLNTLRSWNVNINFAQSSTPIIKNKFGVIGGLGFEMNNYFFQGDNNIQTNDSTGLIEELELDEYNLRRSKFSTMYLTTPIILEAQFGKGTSKERLYISAGAIIGLRITSATKVVHDVNDNKNKFKERGADLNLPRWRIGLTARIGYKDYFSFYGTYYLTPLFEKDTGPELHPLALGIRIDF